MVCLFIQITALIAKGAIRRIDASSGRRPQTCQPLLLLHHPPAAGAWALSLRFSPNAPFSLPPHCSRLAFRSLEPAQICASGRLRFCSCFAEAACYWGRNILRSQSRGEGLSAGLRRRTLARMLQMHVFVCVCGRTLARIYANAWRPLVPCHRVRRAFWQQRAATICCILSSLLRKMQGCTRLQCQQGFQPARFPP